MAGDVRGLSLNMTLVNQHWISEMTVDKSEIHLPGLRDIGPQKLSKTSSLKGTWEVGTRTRTKCSSCFGFTSQDFRD